MIWGEGGRTSSGRSRPHIGRRRSTPKCPLTRRRQKGALGDPVEGSYGERVLPEIYMVARRKLSAPAAAIPQGGLNAMHGRHA